MLLLGDEKLRADAARRLDDHLALVRAVHAGECDIADVHAAKLGALLKDAAGARLYAGVRATAPRPGGSARDRLAGMLAQVPLLTKAELGEGGLGALTRPVPRFIHYWETSGTTGAPTATPKAVDDLLANTVNIGEMWRRFLTPEDVALILIIAPIGPAPYQFEKVMEYLGVMSLRPWVDYIDGDYSKVLRLISELGVNTFVGAPSRLLAMIQFAARQGLPLPRFDTLLLIAEQTGAYFLRHLERLTGARAYVGSYGSSETGTTAVTCEQGRLHLQVQSYLLELYTPGRGTRLIDGSADSGELVVTTLDQPARPLLRYRTGDLIEVTGEPCACGLALPAARTRGREKDLLAFPGGSVRQDEFEAALWPEDLPGPAALNYMLAVDGDRIVVLVTTDQPAEGGWARETEGRLAPVFPAHRLAVTPVDVLPPLASLTGDLGWKLSHVVDLRDRTTRKRLPAHVAAAVEGAVLELEQRMGSQA
jgi:phenylacetate-CoA ligase